jgi:ferredoxin--NADP+ reductase
LRERIENGADYDVVIAIGPTPMMKFVCDVTKEFNIKTIVSLNPIMIDGTGMCGGCRVTVDGKIRYACVEGPDFDGHLVDFDELMSRNSTYQRHEHECRMLKGI